MVFFWGGDYDQVLPESPWKWGIPELEIILKFDQF
jgi:hypothetical protein